jgi:nicotinate phosphoribosyltransferase
MTRRKKIQENAEWHDLLQPIFRKGTLVCELPKAEATKQYVCAQLEKFHPAIRRLLNPHEYPVGLELALHQRKTDLIMQARGLL